MELWSPTWMVRQQLWSPSVVCQCGRWVASTSFWCESTLPLASDTAIVSFLPESSWISLFGGSGSTDTILLCNRRVTSRPDSGRRSALLRENVPGTVTHTLNSGSYIFIPRCLHHRKTLSAGRNITLLIAGLNGYSCLSPYLARCPRTFLAGSTGDSRMQLTEENRQYLTDPQTGWEVFSDLSSSFPVCYFHLMGLAEFSMESFSLQR